MKVFKIRCDVDHFQTLSFVDREEWSPEEATFACQSRLENWKMPQAFCNNSHQKRGNFFQVVGVPGAFALDMQAKIELSDLLEWSGELLPFYLEDEPMYLFNVLSCMNILNKNESDCIYFENTKRLQEIKKYVFYRNRFHEDPVFKIPETWGTEILTYTGLDKCVEETFKGRVEKCGLTGLIFEELWDNGEDD